MTLPTETIRQYAVKLEGVGPVVFRYLTAIGRDDASSLEVAIASNDEKLFRFGIDGELVPNDADDARFARILGIAPELLDRAYLSPDDVRGHTEEFKSRRLAVREAIIQRRYNGAPKSPPSPEEQGASVVAARARLAELRAQPPSASEPFEATAARADERTRLLQKLLAADGAVELYK